MDFQITKLNLEELDPQTRAAYALLTEPDYRIYIRNKPEENQKIIAIGATYQSVPVGLALAVVYPNLADGQILSVYVARKYRKNGIGTRLFERVEQESNAAGGKLLLFNYRKENRYGPAYESIFLKQGWAESKPFLVQYLFYLPMFNPDWINKVPRIPKKYKVFLWKHLKKAEKIQIKHEYQQGRYSAIVNPFFDEKRMEPLNSVGIRCNKEVVGWMVNHRIALDTVRYSAIFVRPELQFTGIPIRMMVETVKLQRKKQATLRWVVLLFNVQELDPIWNRFVKKRFAPLAQAVIRTYQTWKKEK